ncbi:adenylate kinase family protein [Holospora undulata]|uniref:Adenylate kinase n=1 Tax=Holospora undulata HU1 TaxID=1321371 RepID=A0A061JID2_9PROT|nr:nucleoside monophosphate kinase [Holospora undulata]ETZ04774.1 adenylate kinase [Holospora undulata HU1]
MKKEIMKKGIVFFGPPGSGKGTQSILLSDRLNIPLVAMGQLLRTEVVQNTSLGKKIEDSLKRGEYLSTSDVMEVLKIQLDKFPDAWVILDGVPRSIEQAEAVEQYAFSGFLCVEAVVFLQISPEKVWDRIRNRLSCVQCQKDYCHKVDLCSNCGSKEFSRRSDDKEEVVLRRLNVFNEKIRSIFDFYNEQKKVYLIQADRDVEEVYSDIIACILPLMKK